MEEVTKYTDEEKKPGLEGTEVLTAAERFMHEEGEVHLRGPMRFRDLFAFRIRYSFLGWNGLAYWILAVLILGCLIGYWSTYQVSTRVLMIFLLGVVLIYVPGNNALRTLQYVTALKADGIEMEYYINRSGVLVIQGEQSELIPWNVIRKTKETRNHFFIYVMKNSAFVFGKDMLGEQTERMRRYISEGRSQAKETNV